MTITGIYWLLNIFLCLTWNSSVSFLEYYITQLKLKAAQKSHLVYYHACVHAILHQNKGQWTHPIGSKCGETNLQSVFSVPSHLPSFQLCPMAFAFHTQWGVSTRGREGVYKTVSQKQRMLSRLPPSPTNHLTICQNDKWERNMKNKYCKQKEQWMTLKKSLLHTR